MFAYCRWISIARVAVLCITNCTGEVYTAIKLRSSLGSRVYWQKYLASNGQPSLEKVPEKSPPDVSPVDANPFMLFR